MVIGSSLFGFKERGGVWCGHSLGDEGEWDMTLTFWIQRSHWQFNRSFLWEYHLFIIWFVSIHLSLHCWPAVFRSDLIHSRCLTVCEMDSTVDRGKYVRDVVWCALCFLYLSLFYESPNSQRLSLWDYGEILCRCFNSKLLWSPRRWQWDCFLQWNMWQWGGEWQLSIWHGVLLLLYFSIFIL